MLANSSCLELTSALCRLWLRPNRGLPLLQLHCSLRSYAATWHVTTMLLLELQVELLRQWPPPSFLARRQVLSPRLHVSRYCLMAT